MYLLNLKVNYRGKIVYMNEYDLLNILSKTTLSLNKMHDELEEFKIRVKALEAGIDPEQYKEMGAANVDLAKNKTPKLSKLKKL